MRIGFRKRRGSTESSPRVRLSNSPRRISAFAARVRNLGRVLGSKRWSPPPVFLELIEWASENGGRLTGCPEDELWRQSHINYTR